MVAFEAETPTEIPRIANDGLARDPELLSQVLDLVIR